MDNVTISIFSAMGMLVVATVAVIYWRSVSKLQFKWFWAGGGLWAVAVVFKMLCALLANKSIIGFLKAKLSYSSYVMAGGLFVGIQSSLFEIGLTLLAVFIWRQLGQNANRAIGIGVGAGSVEAMLLGIGSLVAMISVMASLPGTEKIRASVDALAAGTPVFWLLSPFERVIAILCHASTRALVLLGVVNKKPMMVIGGFLIFTGLDAIAGATQLSGKMGQISMWWIELSLLPFAAISIPILKWCYQTWRPNENSKEQP